MDSFCGAQVVHLLICVRGMQTLFELLSKLPALCAVQMEPGRAVSCRHAAVGASSAEPVAVCGLRLVPDGWATAYWCARTKTVNHCCSHSITVQTTKETLRTRRYVHALRLC